MAAGVIWAFLNALLPARWQVLLLSQPSTHSRCSITDDLYTSAIPGEGPLISYLRNSSASNMLYHFSLQMICLKVWARVSQLSQTSSLPKSFIVFSLMTSFTCWVRHNGLLFTSSLMSLDNPCQLSLCSAATECFLQDGLCTLQFVLFDQCAGLNTWNEM